MQAKMTDHSVFTVGWQNVEDIRIVSSGIIIVYGQTDFQQFFPWHRVFQLSGTMGKFEHELAQLEHIGVGD